MDNRDTGTAQQTQFTSLADQPKRDVRQSLLTSSGQTSESNQRMIQNKLQLEGLPERLNVINKLQMIEENIKVPLDSLHYDIFEQAYLDLKTKTFKAEDDVFEIDQTSKQKTIDLEKFNLYLENEHFNSELDPKSEIKERNQKQEQAYNKQLSYQETQKKLSDVSQNEIFINLLLNSLCEDENNKYLEIKTLDSHNNWRPSKCSEVRKKIIKNLPDGSLAADQGHQSDGNTSEDESDNFQKLDKKDDLPSRKNYIHRNLICSGTFSADSWMLEIRKSIQIKNQNEISENQHQDKLTLQIHEFPQNQNAKPLYEQSLIDFDDHEVAVFFNNNFECLFNHIQIRNRLFYFSVERFGEISKLKLNKLSIETNNGEMKKPVEQMTYTQLSQEDLNMIVEDGKLLGSIIIQNPHHETIQQADHFDPKFYFALIVGKIVEEGEIEICYDIRHSLQPQDSIKQLKKKWNNKNEMLSDCNGKEFVLVYLNAQTIFKQLLLTQDITREAYDTICSNANAKVNNILGVNNNSVKEMSRVNKQFTRKNNEETKSALFRKQATLGYEMIKDLNIFIMGQVNEYVFDCITDQVFISQGNKIQEILKDDLIRKDNIQVYEQRLLECLRMLSMEHTCSIVNFNSSNQEPEMGTNKICRGQIELIKKVLGQSNIKKLQISLQDPQFKFKSMDDKLRQSTNQNQATQEGQQIKFKKKYTLEMDPRTQAKYEINQGLKKFRCTSLIDRIQRKIHLLLYHKSEVHNQFLVTIKLFNLSQINNVESFTKNNEMDLNKQVKLTGYNDMFKKIIQESTDEFYVQKFIVSKRFDNVMRGIDKVFWIDQDHLYSKQDSNWTLLPLRSRFEIQRVNNQNFDQVSKLDCKNQIIFSIINDNQVLDDEQYSFNVKEFNTYDEGQIGITPETIIQPHQVYYEFDGKKKEQKKTVDDEQNENEQIKQDSKSKKDKQKEKNFNFEGNYLILQNVITVEDDRKEIPVVSIGNNFEALQFALINGKEIKAITSLQIDGQTIKESSMKASSTLRSQNKLHIFTLGQNYQNLVQLCASSDVLEGYDANGKGYIFQNYTIAIHYETQQRFTMYDYQVQWIPNTDKSINQTKPFIIKINLIKLREIIFKSSLDENSFAAFTLVPLYEQQESKSKIYKINGTQLILKLKDEQLCHVDFRNLQQEQMEQNEEQLNEINYNKRLIYSKTKRIIQHHFHGIFVETQFKHQRSDDINSDYVNSTIFNEWESFQILKEANASCLNSLPIDIVALMDHPDINHHWFQSQNSAKYTTEAPLNFKDLMKGNIKRYFSSCELLDGYQIFDSYGLEIREKQNHLQTIVDKLSVLDVFHYSHQEDANIFIRDPYRIRKLFEKLDKQEQVQFYDFIFFKDLRTPKFALTFLESIMIQDENVNRLRIFKQQGLMMDGKDVITTNLDQKSVIEKPLKNKNNMIFDIYLRELYENNQFTENKYSQLMRILPNVLAEDDFQSNWYFQFFEQQYQESNYENAQLDQQLKSSLDPLFLDKKSMKRNTLQNVNPISFSQFFPDQYQDQIDRYTDKKLQIFRQSSINSYMSLKYTNSMDLAFNSLKDQYSADGSKYEVLATNIDFRPYILGKKIKQMSDAKNYKMIQEIKKIRFNNYELAILVKNILEKTEGKIEDQKVLRDILDYQFKYTRRSYYMQFWFLAIFYCFPFWYQMTHNDYWTVLIFNQSCLIVQLIFMFYEVIQFCDHFSLKQHFNNIWNFVDALNFILYFIYYVYRMNHITDNLIPSFPEDVKDLETQVPLAQAKAIDHFMQERDDHHGLFLIYKSTPLHVALVVISFLKLQSLLRVNEEFGQFIKLIQSCLRDTMVFNLYFMANIFVFAKLLQILGVEVDEDEYPLVPNAAYYLFTFRAALGESEPPKYPFWKAMRDHSGSKSNLDYPMIMIYLIWIIWFCNLTVNMILLINFLVAIITTSYDRVISSRLVNRYKHMSDLNVEILQFHHAFRHTWKFVEYDQLQTVSCHTEDLTRNNEVNGLTFNLKIYFSQQLAQLKEEINRRIQISQKVTNISTNKIEKYMDDKFACQLDKMKHYDSKQEVQQKDQQDQLKNTKLELQDTKLELVSMRKQNKVMQQQLMDLQMSIQTLIDGQSKQAAPLQEDD